VLLSDPHGPHCLTIGTQELGRGGTVSLKQAFTGVLYDPNAQSESTLTYPAPAGRYTVIATFVYQDRQERTLGTVESRTSFVWQP